MKNLMLFFLVVTIGILGAVAVDGNLFLENQTDHSGAHVKFERTVPSSLQEIVSTDAEGYYTADLEGGIYDVTFYKIGYVSSSLTDQTLYSDITLSDVTIIDEGLSGTLTGILEAGIYTVGGDIIIPNGQTLTIEAGTTLKFMDNVQFDVHGLLIAEGTEIDSIVFTRNGNGITWGGIDFNEDSNDNSSLKHCVIEYSNSSGICAISSSPLLDKLLVTNNTGGTPITDFLEMICGVGVCLYESNSEFKNSIISNNTGVGEFVFVRGGGILIKGNGVLSNLKIIGNSIESDLLSDGGGIAVNGGNPVISDVIIEGNSANTGGGIYVEEGSVIIKDALIMNNTSESRGGGIYNGYAGTLVTNSTIVGNTGSQGAGICYYASGAMNIYNTIISNNIGPGIRCFDESINISHCNFSGNSDGNFVDSPEWVGEIVTENSNGTACDAYFNIFENPLFETGSYFLSENSPCIDAGNPDSEYDPDNSVTDIGAYYYDQGTRADFSANVTTGSCPLTVDFTDLSEPGSLGGEIINWQWDFDGDEVIDSEEQNPQWIYNEIGNYNVTLTVGDGTYSDIEIKNNFIITINAVPIVDNYIPEINNFVVFEDSTVVFSVSASDADSELSYQWFVNNEEQIDVSESFSYNFIQTGDFVVKSIVADEDNEIVTEWSVTVEPVSFGSDSSVPNITELNQNHPNPFNPETVINFNIKEGEVGSLIIFNVKGQILAEKEFEAGKHSYRWDGSSYSSGVYFYKLESDGFSKVKKMLMLK